MKHAKTELSCKPRLMHTHTDGLLPQLLNKSSSSPDDQDGSGGFVVGGSEHDSDGSGFPGLQQQTQDTSS